MAEKKTPLNPEMDAIIRGIVKDNGYTLDKKETDVTTGTYCIEIPEEEVTFVIYLSTYKDSNMVTFTTVVDELAERADKLDIIDVYSLYAKAAAAVTGYSFALNVTEDESFFVEFRYTVLECASEEGINTGIETCIDATCDYIEGLEQEVGLKY